MDIKMPQSISKSIPKNLILINEVLFDNCNFEITQLIPEIESTGYEACTFKLNNLNILFRTAKITPTKTGQFVTLWKRINQGSIQPFDAIDPIDLFMISVREENHFGLFIFPKQVLVSKEIVSDKKEGKRAIRVYPPWVTTTSKQAQKTQNWQLSYFLETQNSQTIDLNRAKSLIF